MLLMNCYNEHSGKYFVILIICYAFGMAITWLDSPKYKLLKYFLGLILGFVAWILVFPNLLMENPGDEEYIIKI